MWDIRNIFHEKQEGRLCAQHCLNATLQGSYYTAVDLSELAMRLDEEERQQMSESENGVESEDYKQFMQQPSGNMDDTGFFSVQVISRALELWNLELVPLNSTDEFAQTIREDPTNAQAYIFNMESHWFCIRRFNSQHTTESLFFNLNSLLSKPEYMSSLYLTEYLKQMQNEGYSIFVIKGEFPECPADLNPPTIMENTATADRTFNFIDLTKSESTVTVNETDADLQRAIQMSLEWSRPTSNENDDTLLKSKPIITSSGVAGASTSNSTINADTELESALKLSLECFASQELNGNRSTAEPMTPNQLRDKRLAYFNSLPPNEN